MFRIRYVASVVGVKESIRIHEPGFARPWRTGGDSDRPVTWAEPPRQTGMLSVWATIGGTMNARTRAAALLAVWLLSAGSCLLWGGKHLWVAGLSLIAISLTAFAYSLMPDVGAREKQQYTIAGFGGLILGAVLVYAGLFSH